MWNGAALTRGLEFSAREKGIQFMLNRKMTEIIREQQFSGRVLGISQTACSTRLSRALRRLEERMNDVHE